MTKTKVVVLGFLCVLIGIAIGIFTQVQAGGVANQIYGAGEFTQSASGGTARTQGYISNFVVTASEDGKSIYLWHVYAGWAASGTGAFVKIEPMGSQAATAASAEWSAAK